MFTPSSFASRLGASLRKGVYVNDAYAYGDACGISFFVPLHSNNMGLGP
jgi:hypothetical protein